ncbi:MAG TPA: AMP-binding protein [Myxococcales bacterium]|nr:AMP-binding protein [Myxococcales bacterium]
MNLADRLLSGRPGTRPALLTLEAEQSYAELSSAVSAVSAFLLRSGAESGECVGIVADNSPFWVAAWLGAIRAGCVAVPVSQGLSPADCQAMAEQTRMRFAFIEARMAAGCARWLKQPAHVVLDEPIAAAPFAQATMSSFRDLLAFSDRIVPSRGGGEDLAAILFSSGSTGKPRGVMLSHRNFIANTESILQALGLTAADRAMAVLPFHYSFGASVLHTHLAVGGTLVIDKRFLFPDKVLQRMVETRCTGFAGVPSHYQILLRKSRFKQMELPDLRWMQQAGGKLQEPFVRELREAKPGVRLYVMYGATEATARLSVLPPSEVDRRPGSIGKGIPGVTLRVLNERGVPVAPGEVGEIVAEGDNIARGYFQDPAETAATFVDGRLRTGDLATVDADGYLTVLGRAKSFLKCGGTRTSAERFEEALLAFPDIVEAAVIGVPDEVMGEAAAAFVVPRDPRDPTVAERLGAFAAASLPLALRPKLVEVVPDLPKSAAGKVLRIRLHERLRARQDAAECTARS